MAKKETVTKDVAKKAAKKVVKPKKGNEAMAAELQACSRLSNSVLREQKRRLILKKYSPKKSK